MFPRILSNIHPSLRNAFLLVGLILVSNVHKGQDLDPHFSIFIGSVYSLPYDSLPYGYMPYIKYIAPIDMIFMSKLIVQENTTQHPFPKVAFKEYFGIIFKSKMTIAEDGLYEFALVSDDGSKFWIDEQLIVDNDKPHGMRLRKDSVNLRAGTYPVKVWYYQAYPEKYGLVFGAKHVGPFDSQTDTLNWDSEILFDFDDYAINPAGISKLDSFVNFIQDSDISQIEIIGHTDDWGETKYNYDLSLKRAKSIVNYLERIKACSAIHFIPKGEGESKPLYPNNSRQNRARNRRVEIVFY